MKFSVLTVLLFVVAAAQDPNTGGQAGSVTNDANIHTPPPVTAAPPMPNAGPAGVNPPPNNAPVPPFGAPVTPAPWNANPVPMTESSASGSFGSAGDIETPVTKRPKRNTDSSRSQSTPTPTEDSGAVITATSTGAWAIAALLGLAAML